MWLAARAPAVMRRGLAIVAALGALAGCERDHRVRILLGPDEDTLTRGFLCDDDDGMPLAARGVAGGHLRFNLVVDLIALGGVPGCRGEELLAWCEAHTCAPIAPAAGRYCVPLDLVVDVANLPGIVDQLYAQLAAAPPIAADAPTAPVVVRAVATTQTCAEVADATDFAPEALIGCAYSCPVQLDLVDDVQLSLDTLSSRCEREVIGCANGPW